MSKSLNFVVSIWLDKRSSNANGDYPIKLRVWNRATKKVKLYSCNKFTDTTLFEKALNQGATVKGETFKLRVYLKRVLSNASEVLENNNEIGHWALKSLNPNKQNNYDKWYIDTFIILKRTNYHDEG